MFKKLRIVLLNGATAAFLLGTNQAYSAIFTAEGFESGSIAGYGLEIEGKGSFQVIFGDAREGSKFLRITKDENSRRYELVLHENSKPADIWYGFSMRLPSDMQSTDEYFIINQWHHYPPDTGEDWHKPDAFLRLNSNYKVGISNYWDSRRITPSSELGGEGKRSNISLLTMNRDQWYDFVVHYKYSSSGDGLIEVFGAAAGSNLQLLQKLTGLNSFNDARGQFRIGLYGEEDDFSAYIDYDAVRIGSSFDDVLPR